MFQSKSFYREAFQNSLYKNQIRSKLYKQLEQTFGDILKVKDTQSNSSKNIIRVCMQVNQLRDL